MGQIPRSIERISRMLYSCTHMATVGIKVLIDSRSFSQTKTRNTVRQSASGKFMYCTYVWVWLLHNEERAMTFQLGVGAQFNAPTTQSRPFRRQSSRTISWLILTNKAVQENTQTVQKSKQCKTKLSKFRHLLRQTASKWDWFILQHSQAHFGQNTPWPTEQNRAINDSSSEYWLFILLQLVVPWFPFPKEFVSKQANSNH